MEKTLVLLKPDAVQRGLCGEIIARLERTGLKIVGMKLMQVSEDLANRHYGEHVGKPFFGGLVGFITSGPIVAMAFEGNNAVSIVEDDGGDQSRGLASRLCQGRLRCGHRQKPGTRLRFARVGGQGTRPVLLGGRTAQLRQGNGLLDYGIIRIRRASGQTFSRP